MLGKSILAVYPHRGRSSEVRYAPPIGLEYVMAAVEDLVEKITVVDMRFEENDDLARFLHGVDTVCVSLNWPLGPTAANGVAPEFNLINRIPPGIFTVVGGRWATVNTDVIFENCPGVDVVVRGDGEETIRELARAKSLDGIEGIAYRVDGKVQRNAPRRFAPLSEAVYPNRALRRYDYRVAARGIDFGFTLDMVLTSRGCPFRCKFCASHVDDFGRRRRWEPRSPESVLAELRKVDAEAVLIADNDFCIDMDRVGAICDLVLKEGIRKIFALEARIDIARRPDVLAKMDRAGFRLIMFGLESACDASLEVLNKGFTVANVRQAFEVLRRYRFILGGFFIVGNIGEDAGDMLRMSRFAKELGLDFIALSYLRVDFGSALEEVIARHPGYHIAADKQHRVWSDRYPLKTLRRIRHAVARDFYFSPHMLRSIGRALLSGDVRLRHVRRFLGSALLLAAAGLLPRHLARRFRRLSGRR
ncbi:MAG: radical SAM protein [Acidobacteria bacterium]|nr:MAG: radical SAM protein [Acidobacteriota bacterium]